MAEAAQAPSGFEPLLAAFVCNWCTYTGADLAGTSRLPMAVNVRIIRLPCTGRIDPLFVLKAFERGADGVIVSGCHPADCHYTSGNYHARRRFTVFRELLLLLGIEPQRVTFSWVSASEGNKWQQVVDEATAAVRELGPFAAYRALHLSDPLTATPSRARSPEPPQQIPDGRGEAWQVTAENDLQELASRLLKSGEVAVVIGWEEGSGGVRPAFVRRADDVQRLVFDRRAVHNPATYLAPRRTHLRRLGRPAVVVKGCDAKAVAGLIREQQLAREDMVLIGVRCPGVRESASGAAAARCSGCDSRTPSLADHIVGELPPDPPKADRGARLADLEAASAAERWAFWQGELARCVRCHACRQVCPMCYCARCVADKARPQWIESSPHGRGNLAWHITRALHLAGRCVGCGECARACPVEIPLGLITERLTSVVADRFGHRVNDDPQCAAPLGTFAKDDPQEFFW